MLAELAGAPSLSGAGIAGIDVDMLAELAGAESTGGAG